MLLGAVLLTAAGWATILSGPAHAQTPIVEAENDDGETLWQVNDDGGFAVFGAFDAGDGTIPAEGGGARLMWHPEKAAFRAGGLHTAREDAWDDFNVGDYSTAMGSNTTARGSWSSAIGFYTIANNSYSLSAGRFNDANRTRDGTLFVVGNGSNDDNRSDALVLDEDGNLEIAGSLTESSDRRLKTDIAPLEAGVLEQLAEIRPVRYRFREGTGHPTDEQIGLIAQEVAAQFPELVTEGADGSLSLSYTKFTAVLVKGLQEQQGQIDALEAKAERVDALKARLDALERTRGNEQAAGVGFPIAAVWLLGLTLAGGLVFGRRRAMNTARP